MSDFQRGDRVRTTRGRTAHAFVYAEGFYYGNVVYFACDGPWGEGHGTETVTAAPDDLPPCKRCEAKLRKEYDRAKDKYERWSGVGT